MAVNTVVTIACLLRALYGCFNDCGICSIHANICRTHKVVSYKQIDWKSFKLERQSILVMFNNKTKIDFWFVSIDLANLINEHVKYICTNNFRK